LCSVSGTRELGIRLSQFNSREEFGQSFFGPKWQVIKMGIQNTMGEFVAHRFPIFRTGIAANQCQGIEVGLNVKPASPGDAML